MLEGLYYLDVRSLEEAFFSFLKTLSKEERSSVIKYYKHQDQLLALGKYLLLHRYIGDTPIKEKPNRKPYVEGKEFSLSHSYPYVGLLLLEKQCGLDIESSSRNELSALETYFDVEEDSFNLSLLQRWILKEAAYKCIGEGTFNPKTKIESLEKDSFLFMGKKIYYQLLELGEHGVAICALSPLNKIKVEEAHLSF